MKFNNLIVLLFLMLLSCSEEKDDQFCRCLEISGKINEKLNQQTNNKEVENLYREKKMVCEPYRTMAGEETKKLQKECENQ